MSESSKNGCYCQKCGAPVDPTDEKCPNGHILKEVGRSFVRSVPAGFEIKTKAHERKKKTTFRKIEEGMIYQTEDGEALAVGVPKEVETLTAGEGKGGLTIKGVTGEVKGERYKRVVYDWHFSVPLEAEEAGEWADAFSDESGSCVDSVQTGIPYQTFNFCPECRHSNPKSAIYCNKCGQEL